MIETRLEGTDKVIARVEQLYITPAKEREILRGAGKSVVKAAKQRVREQRDLEGRPFAPRKREPRRKTIRKIAKHLRVALSPGEVVIYVGSGRVGTIARQLQEGALMSVVADQVADQRGRNSRRKADKRRRDRVYKRQVRAADRAGRDAYRKARDGGASMQDAAKEARQAEQAARARFRDENVAARLPGEEPTRAQLRSLQRWFRRTPQMRLKRWFTRQQAGYLIRKLEGAPAKSAWQINIPARAFLGVSNAEREALGQFILGELRKAG